MTIAVYPGSFDPLTFGHLDIIERSLKFLDNLVIGIGNNQNKNPLFSLEERLQIINECLEQVLDKQLLARVNVKTYNGLLIDFAKSQGAHLIIRGVRATSDFDAEFNLAGVNIKLCPAIETIFLIASEGKQFVSSLYVKEIAKFKGDISKFVPDVVVQKLHNKFNS
ncbi:Pantetheine-phosphate adenylyltransferase [Candidatus Hepatincolaceae symbiont of Richtersius coronifer]